MSEQKELSTEMQLYFECRLDELLDIAINTPVLLYRDKCKEKLIAIFTDGTRAQRKECISAFKNKLDNISLLSDEVDILIAALNQAQIKGIKL